MINFAAEFQQPEEEPKASFTLGADLYPESLTDYSVTIKSLGLDVTINETILVRGDSDKNDQDEFWYNHLNGNGVLELLAQLHGVYGSLCEYRDTVKASFLSQEAYCKNKYKNGSTKRITNEMFEVLMEVNRGANQDYWTLKEELGKLDRQVERVSRSLDLMNKVYEVARTRNANARAMK